MTDNWNTGFDAAYEWTRRRYHMNKNYHANVFGDCLTLVKQECGLNDLQMNGAAEGIRSSLSDIEKEMVGLKFIKKNARW